MNNEETLKLANDMDLVLCKSVTFAGGLGYGLHEDELEKFYRAAFNAGLEAGAKRTEEWVDTKMIAAAIRALKEQS